MDTIRGGSKLKRHTVILTIFVLGLTIFAQGANSVPIQKKKQQELKHEVTVTLKLIQVYVTDKKGNPVTDLNKDDFKIYDKKKLKEITEFERYALIPQKDKTETQPPKIINIPAEETPDIMNRKFFFFFDLANNNTKGFLKSQQAALHFIDTQLHPSDEVGVLSFSVLKGLVLHEYFTKDRQAIRNVVEQIEAEGRAGRADNFEFLLWRELSGEKAVDVSSSGSPIWSAKQDPRLGRLEHKNIVRRMILKITDLAKALCYIPGLKHILLFSSGIPYSLIYGLSTGKLSPVDLGLDRVLVNKYEEMLKELSNANTTIFSLNTEMLATNMNVPANVKGELTLRRMSQYTGGKFLGNVQIQKRWQHIDNQHTAQLQPVHDPVFADLVNQKGPESRPENNAHGCLPFTLMPEMAHASEYHCQPCRVCGGNHIVVAHGTTRLDQGCCPCFSRSDQAIRKWEKRI